MGGKQVFFSKIHIFLLQRFWGISIRFSWYLKPSPIGCQFVLAKYLSFWYRNRFKENIGCRKFTTGPHASPFNATIQTFFRDSCSTQLTRTLRIILDTFKSTIQTAAHIGNSKRNSTTCPCTIIRHRHVSPPGSAVIACTRGAVRYA